MDGFLTFMIGIWIAILSETLMSIQGVWKTQVTKQSSLWVSTGWVQLTAFLVCVAAWFFPFKRLFFHTEKSEHLDQIGNHQLCDHNQHRCLCRSQFSHTPDHGHSDKCSQNSSKQCIFVVAGIVLFKWE